MLDSLRIYFKKTNTHPHLGDLVQECLQNWLNNKPMIFHSLALQYHHLLAQQAALRWDQLFYARFTKAWCTQEEHLHNHETQNATKMSKLWLVSLITKIWSHIHKNWEAYNDDHHGFNMAMREATKHETAKRETMELYEHHHRVFPQD